MTLLRNSVYFQIQISCHLNDEDVNRNFLVSGLPDDALEDKIIIHFQKGKNGGGGVEKILWNQGSILYCLESTPTLLQNQL